MSVRVKFVAVGLKKASCLLQSRMEKLVRFLEGEGKDASELDEAVADYMVQLANEGGTEEEVWSVLEGCFPELEEVRKISNGISLLYGPHEDATCRLRDHAHAMFRQTMCSRLPTSGIMRCKQHVACCSRH